VGDDVQTVVEDRLHGRFRRVLDGDDPSGERIVLFNTGTGLKYL